MVAAVILRVVLQNISSLLQEEFALLWGVDREMRKLSNTLATIQGVLEDAEEKQWKDKTIKNWLKKLKEAAYDADDILDECAAKALEVKAQMGNCNNCTNQVSQSFLSWFNFEQLLFRHKIAHRIKDIRERFDDIAEERSKFHLNPRGTVEWTVNESSTERETSSTLPTEHPIYGREEDKEKIVKVLLDNNSNPNLLIYPIIGIGGLGKTTLAQLVYNDERVKNHFETRNWVCVSDDFDIKRLTKAIIESMGGTAHDLTELDPLQSRLREMLSRKRRLLLVLDDVWNEDQDKWDRVKSSLTCGNEGCAFLVTTRVEKVASIMGTFPAHHLEGLSEDDCWALFKQRAFGYGREEKANLVVIGKQIVKKCGGLPLAAKALGSLMRFKHTETEWMFVRDSEIWDLPEDPENSILPALRISYNHLPAHLRQCFAYCSIFPRDRWIKKERLVHLWMVNGFIPSKGKMELEDIGNEIFNELLLRSFFQEVRKNEYGDVESWTMHDLVHDLACSVMDNGCLASESNKEKIVPKEIRHLSLNLNWTSPDIETFIPSFKEYLRKPQTIRSLLIHHFQSAGHFDYSNLRCLRALDLDNVYANYLPSSVANLIHLRYLNLSGMCMKTLPESLSNLKHLQTLKLQYCSDLRKLPASMSTMSSLRHLDIHGCSSLSHVPSGLGRLSHLQTLSLFIVGKKSGCRVSELQGLNLRGELYIKSLENVKDSMDAKEANLIRKRNLDFLTLSWSPNIETQIQENSEEVLEGLQPPANIRILAIEDYQGMKFPSWIENLSLQNLVSVELSNCKRCEHFPPLGQLPLLKFLNVRGMDSVRHLGVDLYNDDDLGKGFPSLEKLVLENMLNLEELLLNVPEGREVLPRLVSMRIKNCDKLITLPLLPSLRCLELGTTNENIPEGLLQKRRLPILQEMVFKECPNFITLPILSIRWEDESQVQGLSSLKILKIRDCDKLASLSGIRYLTALEDLRIYNCPDLELSQLEEFQHLTSFQNLHISNLPKLKSLPEDLKHATMLQYLYIYFCHGLTALPEWIPNLTSLRRIDIYDCPNLAFLPDCLPQVTSLQGITIRRCPILEKRCREGGEDWHKISHLSYIYVSRPIRIIQNRGYWGLLLKDLKRMCCNQQ